MHVHGVATTWLFARAGWLLLVLTLSACASADMLARRIAEPGAIGGQQVRVSASVYRTIEAPPQRLTLPGGPTLAYRVVQPAYYDFHLSQQRRANTLSFDMHFRAPTYRIPERGTVVALHGWSLDGNSLLPWALGFAERGYRVVLVDLRSHGLSDTAAVGYGSREGSDVASMIRALRLRGEITQPLTLFGVSYGAVSSIYAAAELRSDIDAVVALEPFASAGEGIRDLIRGTLNEHPHSLRGRLQQWFVRRRIDADSIAAALPRAGQLLGLNLDALDTRTAMANVRACTLLLHGDADTWLPVSHSRQLLAVNAHAQLQEMPDESHVSLPLRIDWLLAPLASWLAKQADRSDCVPFALPPAPSPDDDGKTYLASPVTDTLPGPWQP